MHSQQHTVIVFNLVLSCYVSASTQGVCCATGLTVELPDEADTARSTAGLLSPDSSAVVGTPATPHLSVSQASEPGNRGYLADGITRWGSFTQEQLAAFG